MIREEDMTYAGRFGKPHGVKGEISFTFADGTSECPEHGCLVCRVDGMLVPFFVDGCRFRSATTALVKLEDIDTTEAARRLTNAEAYFPVRHVGEEEELDGRIPSWRSLEGFRAEDTEGRSLGRITAVDDSTMNVLLAVEREDGTELLLPAHEELVAGLDRKAHVLTLDLPEGLT